jgi:hypothetical protein
MSTDCGKRARNRSRHPGSRDAARPSGAVHKDAIRRVSEMTYDNAEDYLIRAQEAANFFDNDGRKEGIRQFIDEKAYKPGLGAYHKSKQTRAQE